MPNLVEIQNTSILPSYYHIYISSYPYACMHAYSYIRRYPKRRCVQCKLMHHAWNMMEYDSSGINNSLRVILIFYYEGIPYMNEGTYERRYLPEGNFPLQRRRSTTRAPRTEHGVVHRNYRKGTQQTRRRRARGRRETRHDLGLKPEMGTE